MTYYFIKGCMRSTQLPKKSDIEQCWNTIYSIIITHNIPHVCIEQIIKSNHYLFIGVEEEHVPFATLCGLQLLSDDTILEHENSIIHNNTIFHNNFLFEDNN